MKRQHIITATLLVGLLFVGALVIQAITQSYRMPGNNQGYEPVQPISYSHRLHAGELGIDCQHCHTGAASGRTAGIPPAATCHNCHRFITAPFNEVRQEDERAAQEERDPRRLVSPELRKVYDALGLDDDLRPVPSREQRPIAWVKVHTLPDYVVFDHRAHVNARVDCQTCHGEVQTMERVRQVSDLTMGWCVNCHRDATENGIKGRSVNASIDCATCHY